MRCKKPQNNKRKNNKMTTTKAKTKLASFSISKKMVREIAVTIRANETVDSKLGLYLDLGYDVDLVKWKKLSDEDKESMAKGQAAYTFGWRLVLQDAANEYKTLKKWAGNLNRKGNMTCLLALDVNTVKLNLETFGKLNDESKSLRVEFNDDAEALFYSVGRASA